MLSTVSRISRSCVFNTSQGTLSSFVYQILTISHSPFHETILLNNRANGITLSEDLLSEIRTRKLNCYLTESVRRETYHDSHIYNLCILHSPFVTKVNFERDFHL
jgi:hypothetical protein